MTPSGSSDSAPLLGQGTNEAYVVCGSRDWPESGLWLVTAKMIELIPHGSLVITGGARGVDQWAHREALRLSYQTKVMPADWDRYGKCAGVIRNCAMLDEQPAAVLAFTHNHSSGTMHTIREAMKRDICLHWTKSEDLRHPDIAALDSDYEPISPLGHSR